MLTQLFEVWCKILPSTRSRVPLIWGTSCYESLEGTSWYEVSTHDNEVFLLFHLRTSVYFRASRRIFFFITLGSHHVIVGTLEVLDFQHCMGRKNGFVWKKEQTITANASTILVATRTFEGFVALGQERKPRRRSLWIALWCERAKWTDKLLFVLQPTQRNGKENQTVDDRTGTNQMTSAQLRGQSCSGCQQRCN